ncbi:tetratricopeptide repeat protein [Sphingorhabdus sp.]|uniref:tetratricopeptide repeat protein n=1 Tax=Sphingorhabdus sp. TaxID=1902408 RepID=UPI0037C68E5F
MLKLLSSLLFIAAPASAQPLPTLNEVQFDECIKLAGADPASAVTEASLWTQQGGGYLARACHGYALATDFKFDLAIPMLTEAAKLAEDKGDARAARFWAQAGNAALAANAASCAVAVADNEVDRARALVALNRPADAEAALTTARKLSPENGTAWLLSATLARRMNKLPDALSYIQTTAALLPRDAAVALEAGNIAIAAGDEAAARKQWEQSIAIASNSRQAATATAQLAALAASAPPPTEPQSR